MKTHLEAYKDGYKSATSHAAHEIDTGDSAEAVARVVLKAATDPLPGLRYTAGRGAGTFRFLRWSLPTSMFDQGVRRHFDLK